MHALIEQLARHGLPLVFANVLLEQLGLPIPAIPTLVAAGALSAGGRLSAGTLIVLALLASLVADSLWYLLGRRHGYRILKTVCGISLSPDSCVRQTESLFERQGAVSLLYAKFIPGFSTVAPPLAGASGAGVARFTLYDSGGALLWAGSGVVLGMAFHRAVDRVLDVLASFGSGALVVVLAALLLFMAWKYAQRRAFYKALRMARISPDELYQAMESGKSPLVADVRSPAARKADPRRIPGARSLELSEIDAGMRDFPVDREIILYCT